MPANYDFQALRFLTTDRFPMTHESVQGGVCHRVWTKFMALIGYARVSTED
jgi:hypothetical protein